MQKLIQLGQYLFGHLPGNAWAFIGVAVVFIGFWLVGRLLWKRSSAGEAALAGWSLLYVISVSLAVAGLSDLRWTAGLFAVLAVTALVLSRGRVLPAHGGWVALLLIAPVLLVALLMPLMHWDSYWHWVLNGSYLYRFNHFPALPIDGFPSFHPIYPMATSLVYYFGSLATGQFLQTAGLFMNLMLTLVALECATQLLREQSHDAGVTETGALYRYGLPIIAFCIVLSLNPSFRVVNYFSAIADPALGVIVLVMIVRWCSFMGTPGGIAGPDAKRELLLLFLLGALIGGIKHSGWALAFILSASGAFVGIVRRASWPRWFFPAVAVFSGTLFSQVLWSMYRAENLPLTGQFSIKPVSDWRFDLFPGLLQGIRADLNDEPFYYALIAVTTVVGLVALLRRSFIANERLAVLLAFVGVAMPLHFASLLVAYLGTGFNEMEILRAASLHRYSSHIGYAVCVFGLITAASIVIRRVMRSGVLPAGKLAALAVLALYALPLGFNLLLPSVFGAKHFRETYQDLNDSAAKLSSLLPPEDTVAIFGPDWSILFGSYHTWRPEQGGPGPVFKDRKIVASEADLPSATDYLKRWMADPSIDHIWLFDAQVLNTALGHEHARHIFWSRSTGEWRVVQAEAPQPIFRTIDAPPNRIWMADRN
jgi:hypothetical protein